MQEQQQNSSSPKPIASLCLMLALVVSAFLAHEHSQTRLEDTLAYYLESGLYAQELPLYLDYLARAERLSGTAVNERSAINTPSETAFALSIMLDRRFGAYLNEHRRLLFGAQKAERWSQQRLDFSAQYLGTLPAFEFGLVPQQTQPRHLISYLFAETRWANLLLTLVLLGLIAPFIEKTFGRAAVIIWFLTAGAAHGLLYSLAASSAQAILLGASGASAGLIGVFLTVIAIRPSAHLTDRRSRLVLALCILGLYALKSGGSLYFGSTDIYIISAELGAMAMCAALCVLLFGTRMAQTPLTRGQSIPEQDNAEYRNRLQDVFNEICRFNFEQARYLARSLCAEYPNEAGAAKHRYKLEKLECDSSEYQQALQDYIDLICINDDYPAAKSMLHDLAKDSNSALPDEHGNIIKLFRLFVAHSDLRKAERCYRLLRKNNCPTYLLGEITEVLCREFEKRHLFAKAEQYFA